jgi:hypothetical protein
MITNTLSATIEAGGYGTAIFFRMHPIIAGG